MQDILMKWEIKEISLDQTVLALEEKVSTTNLLEFIKFHTTLMSEDPYKRLDALELLNKVLKKISITASQSVHLLQFYVSRLDDQLSVDQVLKGIFSLLETSTVSKTDQLKIPLGIFTELDVQAFPQNTRYTCFQIFEYLLINNISGLKKITKDFIAGFVTTMDGEKDPRNLLLLFRLVRLIAVELDISNHVTDLFEVAFCYFPITFRPPPDDIYQITSDDLKNALREAIISSHLFATHSIPVLLEKLESSSNSAKRDAMDTISASLPYYTANPYLPHLSDLWKAAKNEIAQALDESNELSALKMIRNLSKHLPSAISISAESKTALERWMDLLIPECLENLQHPEQKYAKACGKILMSAASAGESAAVSIITKVLPILLKQFRLEETPSKKQVLLQVINDLMMACRLVYGTKVESSIYQKTAASPLTDFRVELVEIYASIMSIDSGNLKLFAIQGAYEMLSSRSLLTTEDQEILLSHLNTIALSNDHGFVVESFAQLEKLAKEQPSLIKNSSLKLFFSTGIREPSLKAITTICVEALVFEEASLRFFEILSTTTDALTLRPIVRTLLECMQKQQNQNVVLANQILHISNLIRASQVYEIVVNTCYLDMVKILNLILQSLNPVQQSSFFKSSFELEYFQTFDSFERLVFYQACICNARPKVNLCIGNVNNFVLSLVEIGLNSHHPDIVEIVPIIFGSFANKFPETENVFEEVQKRCITVIENEPNSETREKAIIIFAWITKAWVTKGHIKAYDLMAYLLQRLDRLEFAGCICKAIEIIIKDHHFGYLTKKCFANQKILYKQKLYNFSVKLLVDGFEKASEDLKQYYLLALSHLLRNVAKSTLINELPKIFPMLLQSLESTDAQLKRSTLESFTIMITETPDIICNHTDAIVNGLISLFVNKDSSLGNDPHVRVKAINLIGQFPGKIEFSLLSPFKKLVIKKLGIALDDHKLVVRREAANSRGKWYLLVGQKNE